MVHTGVRRPPPPPPPLASAPDRLIPAAAARRAAADNVDGDDAVAARAMDAVNDLAAALTARGWADASCRHAWLAAAFLADRDAWAAGAGRVPPWLPVAPRPAPGRLCRPASQPAARPPAASAHAHARRPALAAGASAEADAPPRGRRGRPAVAATPAASVPAGAPPPAAAGWPPPEPLGTLPAVAAFLAAPATAASGASLAAAAAAVDALAAAVDALPAARVGRWRAAAASPCVAASRSAASHVEAVGVAAGLRPTVGGGGVPPVLRYRLACGGAGIDTCTCL
ncbi:hypothetical protein BU14_0219s0021 [Porphyra umbilicalis]|uniref:Uncharacterized protein n=1 Tax=Porphyra umbilicalis TaxID=2786 RepID=A0A1X6P4L4_PORUM|nr:hypothetical protein BU14_0219s0021 [Porphyra umbilicalis]|eukprot:OSX75821.1 hypothetical protein BU14_0219s0021 [Porphyra umbilicalis]